MLETLREKFADIAVKDPLFSILTSLIFYIPWQFFRKEAFWNLLFYGL